MSKKAFLALILVLCMLLSACQIPEFNFDLPGLDTNDPDDDGKNDKTPPITDVNDAPLNDNPTDWGSSSAVSYGALHTTVMKDVPTDITRLLDDEFVLDGATWVSKCDGIVTVDGGTVTGVKCGRTDVTVTAADGSTQTVTVTVEFLTSSNSGYTFPTADDNTVYKVSSTYEADRLLDRSIAAHKSLVVMDFSQVGKNYNAFDDYHGRLELSSHVSITKKCYGGNKQKVYFEIDYDSQTATEYDELTVENTYSSLANANMIIRNSACKKNERADDYEGFAINSNNSGTMDVYNSEELWWAIENNLKPNFPLRNSKAELFYERAKMLLRDIVTDGMTDFEKVLAIYDCLVNDVSYDYDAAKAPSNDNFNKNVCYYLEGVFERGRAVCDGKTKAFVLLCGIEGIACVRDFGDSLFGGAGHAWNYVKINERWYLVDTTAADASYASDTPFGKFFGSSVEITVYDLFLVPTDTLTDEYSYSGIWAQLPSGLGGVYTEAFITDLIGDTPYNFLIETKTELDTLISMAIDADVCGACILSFVMASGTDKNMPFNSADALIGSRENYAIYTLQTERYTLYYMLIKGI